MTGYLDYFRALANAPVRQWLTASLELQFTNFPEQGLATSISDLEVWLYCQANNLYLITDNRNKTGDDSLEEVLRERNRANSLPDFTVGDRNRLDHQRSYGERLIEKLLEKLLDAEYHRGAGRLFVP